jgi:hypothetical protein
VGGLFLIIFFFHIQYRLRFLEEFLPVATSSVWVRRPRAGQLRDVGFRDVGFSQEGAEGLRKL